MLIRHRVLLLAVSCALPATAKAQTPWTVSLAPTMDPLPIGVCAAVRFTLLDPGTKDVPRSPNGRRVTIADFDMTVTTPDGVSTRGMWIDVSNWRVCACQAATIGTTGTITATYPAAAIAAGAQVPGVAFTSTASFTIGKAQGTYDPPGCAAPRLASGQRVGATPAGRTPVSTSPASVTPASTIPSSTTPASSTPLAVPPMAVGVAQGTTAGGPSPGVPTLGTPVPMTGQTTARSAPTPAPPPPVGPAPTFLQVDATPAEAVVSWSSPNTYYGNPTPTGYVVERWKPADPTCCRAISPVLPPTARSWSDPVQWPGSWRFLVTAQYADGRRGSTATSFNYPLPVAPTNVKAEQFGRDTVVVTWTKVKGASYYALTGPPANAPVRGDSTGRYVFTNVPPGNHSWQVATFYTGAAAGSPNQSSAWVSTPTINVKSRFFRIVAEQIQVTSETVDAPLSTDGKFDEIFVVSRAELLTRQPYSESWGPVRMSAVHGDVTGFPPPQRVKAGSASPAGGIQRGDNIAVWSLPSPTALMGAPEFVLWEGELIEGKHDLVLHPLIFEWDQPDSDLSRNLNAYCIWQLCNWANYIAGSGSRSSFGAQVQALIAGPVMGSADGVRIWPGEMPYLERHDRDRPIGMRVLPGTSKQKGISAELFDKVVVFSREKIEAALANGTNRVSVRFWDHAMPANGPPTPLTYLNGDYTLVLRVDRVP